MLLDVKLYMLQEQFQFVELVKILNVRPVLLMISVLPALPDIRFNLMPVLNVMSTAKVQHLLVRLMEKINVIPMPNAITRINII